MKKLFILITLLSLLSCTLIQKNHYITGHLTGYNGQPMIKANIQLLSNNPYSFDDVLSTYDVDQNGNFSIPVKEKGYYKLRFCGVNHQSLEKGIIIEKQKNIVLDVRLSPIEYRQNLDKVQIIGSFNNFSMRNNTVEVKKDKNNTFSVTLQADADTLAYQILGADVNDHSINGTMQDYYVVDNGGDYISVIKTHGKKEIEIKYDPASVKFPVKPPKVVFGKFNNLQESFGKIFDDVEARNNNFYTVYRSFLANGGKPKDFKYDWEKDRKELNDLWQKENNSTLKKYRFWAKISLLQIDSTDAKIALEEIRPTSVFWSINLNALFRLIAMSEKPDKFNYIYKVIDLHKDSSIKELVYENAMYLASSEKNETALKKLYNDYMKKYSSSTRARYIKLRFSPDKKIQVGKPVPPFKFVSMDNPNKIVNNKKLLGKVYLIDFWATWCGPCVGEMKYLHQCYDKYKSKGLFMISASLDRDIDAVKKFRQGEWKMPWFNTHLDNTKDSTLIRDFEIVSIPKPILVNKKGVIIALESDIRGEKLDKQMSKIFNKTD